MKQVIMFILATGILFACGKKDNKPRLRIKKLKLTETSLYDERLVQDVLFEAEGNNIDSLKKAGKKYFLEGIDYYRNQHMPGMAVKRFKRALLVVPDPKVYYELGNALADLNNAKEAQDAYEMAITTGFEPQANVYTRMAALQYQQYKRLKGTSDNIGLWRTLQSLEKLIMATGGLDTAKLYKDPQWAGIQNEHEYQEMLIGIAAKKLNASDGSLFGLFKRSFTNDASALEIAPEKVDMKAYQQSISYDFEPYVPEMQNATFGRDVNHDFYYVGKVKETSSYTALLYSSVTFTYEAMQPVYTRLVVYNTLGNVVSSKMIGCQCTPEKIKSFSINGDRITVEDYKRVWEKPYKDEGFEHNSIKEHQLLGKAVFRINEQGEIVDEDVPANYTDTNLFVKGNQHMKRHLTLAIILIWILACSKPKPVKELAVMRVSEITQNQKVYNFMKAHGNVGKSIADEYFKQAESLIKTQPDKAIWNIKRAITICPQENYYRELITLLLDLHKYEEANKYLGVLVEEVYVDKQQAFVFDKPNDDDYFQYLLTNLLADPYNIPSLMLSSAVEQGINLNSIKERLLADERFPYKQGSMQYLEFNSWFMREDELANYAGNAENFKEFYQRLPTVGQYAIDLTTVNRFDYNGFRGEEDFSPGRMLYKSFLPEVKNQTNEYPSYNLMAGIRVNEQVVMVVYRIDSSASACPVNMRHVYYSVATYLNNGTLIDFRPVAWQAGKDVATADITPNQIITYQYKRAWKKPYDMYDFDNEVLSTIKADSKTFRITSSGKIEPEGQQGTGCCV